MRHSSQTQAVGLTLNTYRQSYVAVPVEGPADFATYDSTRLAPTMDWIYSPALGGWQFQVTGAFQENRNLPPQPSIPAVADLLHVDTTPTNDVYTAFSGGFFEGGTRFRWVWRRSYCALALTAPALGNPTDIERAWYEYTGIIDPGFSRPPRVMVDGSHPVPVIAPNADPTPGRIEGILGATGLIDGGFYPYFEVGFTVALADGVVVGQNYSYEIGQLRRKADLVAYDPMLDLHAAPVAGSAPLTVKLTGSLGGI